MQTLKTIAIVVVLLYAVVVILLYVFQARLIFYPGKLSKNFSFNRDRGAEEVFLTTEDGETINGLFFKGVNARVILYFHGNAGDLSGWQFVAEDLLPSGYSFLIIDYRGYGKSTGTISEKGLYRDADAAWKFLTEEKGFEAEDIIIYGRSIGTGVAVDLASRHQGARGLVLESPYTSLPALANEKFPMFFPGLYSRFGFDNLRKITRVTCPIVFLHGSKDTLIPASHSQMLYNAFPGKKKLVLFARGSHNDLNEFTEHRHFLEEILPQFFE